MLEGYQIIDADCHVIEPPYMWEKYLEPEFKQYAPTWDKPHNFAGTEPQSTVEKEWKNAFPSLIDMRIDGQKVFNKISEELWDKATDKMLDDYHESAVSKFDPPSQVKAMKKMGIDITFVYPTAGLWVLAINTMEPKVAEALTRAYNNWLRDFCSYDSQMLNGVGAISLHNPEGMVPELHRIAEFGWKAVYLRPNPVKGRVLSDPAYEPFWNECERLGIAVSIHEGSHCRLPSTGADRFDSRFALHACSHPLEQMMAMLALIEGGVLERHPNLRVAFLEAGCGWLPYWLWRLDELEYQNLAWEVKDNVKMKPSEYFRRQCFISIEPDEPYIPELIKYIGEDNILFGSDYPHIDHHPDVVEDIIKLQEVIPKKTLQKILWDNPRRFYGLAA
jgi:predicted TIM-barrel fold metal-dependent hydrolase